MSSIKRDQSFAIVGIGASAGGLEALETLLRHLPTETGLAFVLVQHLDPGHPSLMAELLARYTKMPVLAAENGIQVAPNHFYVIAPNVTLTIKSGVLRAHSPIDHSSVRTHVDTFLKSLAEDQTVYSVGVVLSGAGSDGTVGLKAIKEQGGVTIVQSPTSAKYDSMPLNAISTGLVDFTVPVEAIPQKLVEHAEYLNRILQKRSIESLQDEAVSNLPRICEIVHHVTGHDFTGYKPSTMGRRIERRLQVHHLDSVQAYMTKLEKEPAEAVELMKDFLISVTQFFRDPDAFNALAENIIPQLLKNKGANSRVRVWVPGCASGEEAYSIAMLLSTEMAKSNVAPVVQIFATDIDADALTNARAGRFPVSMVEQLSAERRERFFSRQGDFYHVTKNIRDMCVFSVHNLVRDPPFSSLDMISCRNLLIYMDGGLQKRLIPLFHYALSPRGYLFLGGSEGLADYGGLFLDIDKKHRIYQRIEVAVRPAVFFPTVERVTNAGLPVERAKHPQPPRASDIGSIIGRMSQTYAPPCVVINERGRIVYSAGDTGLYLQQPTGATTADIVDQARQGLRASLRIAITDATKSRNHAVQRNLLVSTPAGVRHIDLIIRPMPELAGDSGLFAVVFQPSVWTDETQEPTVASNADSVVHKLETELKNTRVELQTTVEELETANEEMKSSNEELLSMNEVLQSANEELQTSKEEMQSVNEELATVNGELNHKLDELNNANADLQNLFRSTQIATLFLDRELRIKRYTPAATAIFNLIDSDVGRPISDFASRLSDGNLPEEIREVLNSLNLIERLAYLPPTKSWFMVRILPSRGHENSIDGVVVTFANITALKKAEESLRESEQRLRTLADSIPQLAWTAHPDGYINWYNARWYEYTGKTLQQMEGWGWQNVHDPAVLPRVLELWKASINKGERFEMEFPLRGADGVHRLFLTRVEPLKDSAGNLLQWFGTNTNVDELKKTMDDLSTAKNAAETANKAKDHFLAALSHELRTPLTPVLATSQLLAADSTLPIEQRDMAQMIRRNVELEARLIDDLLDVTRITQNKLELQVTDVDVHRHVVQVIEMCSSDSNSKRLEIHTDLAAGEHHVRADPTRFQQILWNIFKNAVKFTPESGQIRIATSNFDGNRVAIAITDTGVGIQAELIPSIFEIFEQGGREITQKFGGLGLGLAITKALVDLHGGSIRVISEGVDKGSTFTIEFPVTAKPRNVPHNHDVATLTPLNCTVLLVEDHADTRRIMTRLLKRLGCSVQSAATVADALILAENATFHLVISDIGLPDAPGTDLMRELRKRYGLKGIALSGYGMSDDFVKSADAGFDVHLVKPVNMNVLEETVRRLTATD